MKFRKVGITKIVIYLLFATVLMHVSLLTAQAFDQTKDPYTFGGKVGIGTSSPAGQLGIVSTNVDGIDIAVSWTETTQYGRGIDLTYTDNITNSQKAGVALSASYLHTGNWSGGNAGATGLNSRLNLRGSGTAAVVAPAGLSGGVSFRPSGNYTITNVYGGAFNLAASGGGGYTHTITDIAAFSLSTDFENSGDTWNITNLSGFSIGDLGAKFLGIAGTRTNITGLKINKQTLGTNNTGVWLNGNGFGADLVFGTGQNAKFYYENSEIVIDPKVNGNGKLRVKGDMIVDGNIGAKYQDLAEYVKTPEPLTAGTVVMIDPKEINQVLPSDKAYNTLVAGVVSKAPGIILGEGGDDKVMVAHTGRVKVKVDTKYGEISVGDLLVTSPVKGYAMKADSDKLKPGMLLGKALEPIAEGRQGEVLALITLQ